MIEKTFNVEKNDFNNAGKISSQVKSLLKELGVESDILKRIAIACYEAEINLVIHSDGGRINFDVTDEGIVRLAFNDIGPGIENLEKALTPGWSTASVKAREFGFGAGMGLANIKRVSDTFEIDSSNAGTNLRISFQV